MPYRRLARKKTQVNIAMAIDLVALFTEIILAGNGVKIFGSNIAIYWIVALLLGGLMAILIGFSQMLTHKERRLWEQERVAKEQNGTI